MRPCSRPPSANLRTEATSLPARGLFEGDRLSTCARQRLPELVVNAIGLQVEVALIAPTGPWNLDGSGHDKLRAFSCKLERPVIEKALTHLGLDPQPPPRDRAREAGQD